MTPPKALNKPYVRSFAGRPMLTVPTPHTFHHWAMATDSDLMQAALDAGLEVGWEHVRIPDADTFRKLVGALDIQASIEAEEGDPQRAAMLQRVHRAIEAAATYLWPQKESR